MDVRYIHLLLLMRHLVLSKNSDIPQFGQPIYNVTVPSGREAILECIVENLATYKVAWLRVDTQTILTIHSHVITKNHRIGVTHSDRRIWHLHIRDVKESDRGWYMCQINTDPMKSQVGYLDVVVPPDITDYQTSSDTITTEGENVTFGCAATGSPTPNITWRKEAGSIMLTDGREVPSIEGSELNIVRVNRLQMGAYLCIASNGIPPTVSKRIMLIVHFPPMIWMKDQLVGAQVGQSTLLECNSEAYPKTVCYWSRENGDIIYPGPKYDAEVVDNGYKTLMKLTIKLVEENDFGFYKCVIKNPMGEADGSVKLYEIPKPSTTTTTTPTPLTSPYSFQAPLPITTTSMMYPAKEMKKPTRLKENHWNDEENGFKPYQNEILDSDDEQERKPIKVVAAGSSKKKERVTRLYGSNDANPRLKSSHITKLLLLFAVTALLLIIPLLMYLR